MLHLHVVLAFIEYVHCLFKRIRCTISIRKKLNLYDFVGITTLEIYKMCIAYNYKV